MNAAYWISPKGEIIYVKSKHISEVIANPEKFGFTSEFIEYVYKFYKERMGQEGKAREQLMLALFNNGWIRIRKYKSFWSINLKKFSGKAKSYIIQWASKIIKGIHGFKEDDQYTMVKIDQKDKDINTTDIKSLLQLRENIEYDLIETTVDKLEDLKPYDIVYETLKEPLTFARYIKESSLSRLWRHNEDYDCGALTAFRKARDCGTGEPYTRAENKARNTSLVSKLKSMGYSVTKLSGRYPEGGKVVKENSFFVVDIMNKGTLKYDLTKLGKMFDQDSILYIPKGAISNSDSKAMLIRTNDCDNNWMKSLNMDYMPFGKGKIGYSSPIYTSYVNGRPFIFEDVEEEILFGSGFNSMVVRAISVKPWEELI